MQLWGRGHMDDVRRTDLFASYVLLLNHKIRYLAIMTLWSRKFARVVPNVMLLWKMKILAAHTTVCTVCMVLVFGNSIFVIIRPINLRISTPLMSDNPNTGNAFPLHPRILAWWSRQTYGGAADNQWYSALVEGIGERMKYENSVTSSWAPESFMSRSALQADWKHHLLRPSSKPHRFWRCICLSLAVHRL